MNFETLLDALMRDTTGKSLFLLRARADDLCHDRRPALVPACRPGPIDSPRRNRPVGGLGRTWVRGRGVLQPAPGDANESEVVYRLVGLRSVHRLLPSVPDDVPDLREALTAISGIPDYEDGPDFYTLLFGATLGMLLMASANNLLILFLGVEMASVPSYAMVGFLKGRPKSSEASLKFVVYGAGAAGVMLYGISLMAGLLGTANFTEMAANLDQVVGAAGMKDATVRTVLLGALMVFVGLAFKLSIVPFHFWCPDAFEGAAAEVAGYLSVASKAAAFALLIRFCHILIGDHVEGLTHLNYALGLGLGMVAGSRQPSATWPPIPSGTSSGCSLTPPLPMPVTCSWPCPR